jgi:DinB superfamily
VSVEREVTELLRTIDEAFNRRAWHGTNLRGSIRGLTAAESAWRPGPGRHNIWEIVLHTAYWKYAVRQRLWGGKRGSFPIEGSNWFKSPSASTTATWRHDVALLDEQHRALRRLIAEQWGKAGAGRAYDAAARLYMVRGIAFHDVYHAGQIQLLKRLRRARRR